MAVPHRFFCPITQAIMQTPMRDPHGHRFEQVAIAAWLSRQSCCPLGREPMHVSELFLDQLLLDEINAWRRQCADAGISLDDDELTAADLNEDVYVARAEKMVYHSQQPVIPRASAQLVWSTGPALAFSCCDLSPDQQWLVVGVAHQLKVWQMRTREEHATLKPTFGNQRFGSVQRCAVSPCSQGIVAIYADNTLRVWDLPKASTRMLLKGLNPRPTACCLDTGCAKLAFGDAQGTLQVWDVATRKALSMHRRHTDRIQGVAFDPAGSRVATASSDRMVRISAVTGQAPPVVCKGHLGVVFSCIFDSMGGSLLTASEDGTVKLWNSFTGAPLRSYDGHRGPANRAAFSSSGRRVVAASSNGRLKVWDRETGDPLSLVPPPCDRISCFAMVEDWLLVCGLGNALQGSPVQLWRWRMEPLVQDGPSAPGTVATAPAN